jgi:hypothetical protein
VSDDAAILFREYVLDAAGAEDGALRAVLEKACPDCAKQLTAAEQALAELALDVRPRAPRPGLRATVLERIAAQAQGVKAPVRQAAAAPLLSTPGAWRAPQSLPSPSARRSRPWLAAVTATAVCVAAMIGATTWMSVQQERHMAALIAHYDSALQRDDSANQLQQFMDVVRQPAVERMMLAATAPSTTSAQVLIDRQHQRVLIAAANLPKLPAERQHVAWLLAQDGHVVASAACTASRDGSADLLIRVPEPAFATALITEEEPGPQHVPSDRVVASATLTH